MKKSILTLSSFFLFTFQGIAQNHYEIRLDPITQKNKSKSCYKIQLAATDGVDLSLAGQNYRLYYDAAKLQYKSSKSLLPASHYISFSDKDLKGKESAAGMGNLPFNENIGLLSLSVDLRNEKKKGKVLPANGKWKSTCQVCFEKLTPNVEEESTLVWARPELTSDYATAYVEVAEWIGTDKIIPAEAVKYTDELSFNTTQNYQKLEEEITVYPNPVLSDLWVEQSAEAPSRVEIWSITGQKVMETIIPEGANRERISVDHLPSGLYQFRLFKNDKEYTKLVDKVND